MTRRHASRRARILILLPLFLAACAATQAPRASAGPCDGGWFQFRVYPNEAVPDDLALQVRGHNDNGEAHCGWPKRKSLSD